MITYLRFRRILFVFVLRERVILLLLTKDELIEFIISFKKGTTRFTV